MAGPRLKTMVLVADYTDRLSYFDDWLDAFVRRSDLAVTVANIASPPGRRLVRRGVRDSDLIVVLHSALGDRLADLQACIPLLVARRGILITFVGNEVNLPGARLRDKIGIIRESGADVVATQLLQEAGDFLYSERTTARVVSVPHALNPSVFVARTPAAERPVEIGVRTARYPAILGDDGRNRLLAALAQVELEPPLHLDISTTARLDRSGWASFLDGCRGTAATEAGSFYLDPDDELVDRIADEARATVPLTITSDSRALRWGRRVLPGPIRRGLWRAAAGKRVVSTEEEVVGRLDFDHVFDRYFRDRAPAPVYSKAISSRHFDAIGTRTCQILMRGRYNDILREDEHYLGVDHDLTNLEDVLARFRDPSVRDRTTARALELALDAHTHAHRVDGLLTVVGA